MHTAHSILVLMQICMLPLKVYVFSEQEDSTPAKTGGPGDQAFQNASVAVFFRVLHPEQLKLLAEMVQPHRLLQPG